MPDTNTFSNSLAPASAGAGWGWILAYGVLSIVLGILAFLNPFAATYAATLVIGAFLIAAGLVSIAAVAGANAITSPMTSDSTPNPIA